MTLSAMAAYFGSSLLRLSAWLLVAAIVFMPLEHWWGRYKKGEPRPGIWEDLALYFVSGIAVAALTLLLTGIFARLNLDALPPSWVTEWPWLAKVLLVLFFGDFCYYWAHRWSHSSRFLWKFHAVHHQPKRLDWLVNTRTHPFDAIYTRILVFVPSYLIGLSHSIQQSGVMMMGLLLLNRGWSTFTHANVCGRWWLLSHFISTPLSHHWHHSLEQDESAHDKNFAALFPWIDMIFGTFAIKKEFPEFYGVRGGSPMRSLDSSHR